MTGCSVTVSATVSKTVGVGPTPTAPARRHEVSLHVATLFSLITSLKQEQDGRKSLISLLPFFAVGGGLRTPSFKERA